MLHYEALAQLSTRLVLITALFVNPSPFKSMIRKVFQST
jgi:hypothetical protein